LSADAEKRVLGAVEAALFAYSTVAPRLDARGAAAARAAHTTLRAQRDVLHGWLIAAKVAPPVPPPAYAIGPLPGVGAARTLALDTEGALAAAIAVLVQQSLSSKRVAAAGWLAASAARAVGWRAALGITPTTVAYPGLRSP
jgi:hypothetical protein